MYLRIFLYWLPMILIAVANGIFRQAFLLRYFSELRAHQLSTLLLILLCALYTWFIFPHLHVQHPRHAFITGVCWMLLTILFEFGLGRFLKKPWPVLLADYNIASGHIWPLFLLAILLWPWICFLIKSKA